MLKTFVNDEKYPLITLLVVNAKLMTNVFKKTYIFNGFFSQQWQLVLNGSIFPLILIYCTNIRLNYIDFNYDKILKDVLSWDLNKAYGQRLCRRKNVKI